MYKKNYKNLYYYNKQDYLCLLKYIKLIKVLYISIKFNFSENIGNLKISQSMKDNEDNKKR